MNLLTKKQVEILNYYLEMVNGIFTVSDDDLKIETPDDTYIYHSVGALMADITSTIEEWEKLGIRG